MICTLGLTAVLGQPAPPPVAQDEEVAVQALAAALAAAPLEGANLIREDARRRMAAEGLSEPVAIIAVRRDLAAAARVAGDWKLVEAHLAAARDLAGRLEDADLLLPLLVELGRVRTEAGDRHQALLDLQGAWSLAEKVQSPEAAVAAGLALAELLRVNGDPEEADAIYVSLLTLPGGDRLPVALRRAENAVSTRTGSRPELWQRVVELARMQGDRATEARALDALGQLAHERRNPAEAVAFFREADGLDAARSRSALVWADYSQALLGLGEREAARAALERGLAEVDAAANPGTAADLEDSRASLLAELGESAAAYTAVRRAQQLRREAARTSMSMRAARTVPTTAHADNDHAALLAAARNALRESELARARWQRRAAAGVAAAGLLVAAALALAYFYKRRAAQALALAKDAAELRAERTRWQLLRHQLNPHFLYNALACVRGLIVADASSARHMVGRLSDFCRLALERPTGDLRTVGSEMALLAAFLDVEAAGSQGGLEVSFAIDPAAEAGLLPPLLLQPLVENALKYGERAADRVRRVTIAARRTETGGLELEVANTGGWQAPEPDDLPRLDAAGRPGGVGLTNVRERLAAIGAGARLDTHVADGWVRMRITLPALTTAEFRLGSSG